MYKSSLDDIEKALQGEIYSRMLSLNQRITLLDIGALED